MAQKYKTSYPGVRYREHRTRKYNGKLDRYFFIRYRSDGKLHEEGLGWAADGWNAKKASLLLSELKQSHAAGEGPQTLSEKRQQLSEQKERERLAKEIQAKEQLTFAHVFTEIYSPQAENNKTKGSYRREKDLFKLWISPVIGKVSLKDISAFHLERIKKNMSDVGRAPRTISYALDVIRQVFNFSRRNDLFDKESPTTKVKKPKVDNRRLRSLTHDEADILLEALEIISVQLHEISTISLHCGLRAGEIFALMWGDIDVDKEIMALRDTKSGQTRIAFMTQTVKDLISQKKRGPNDEYVFLNRNGNKIGSISKTFDRVVKELKFNEGVTDRRQKVVFHTLRHTYASWMVESGVDLYRVKVLLGHSNIALTERYSHLSNDALQNAVKVFEKSISDKKQKTKESLKK